MEFWETLKGYITPETITVCITLFSFLVALLKMVSVIKDLKTQKAMTMENLLRILTSQNAEEFAKEKEELKQSVSNVIQPLIPYFETMAKVMALSQENTPESRIAILDLIKGLGLINASLIDQAKEVVNQEVLAEEEKKQTMVNELEEIQNKPVE